MNNELMMTSFLFMAAWAGVATGLFAVGVYGLRELRRRGKVLIGDEIDAAIHAAIHAAEVAGLQREVIDKTIRPTGLAIEAERLLGFLRDAGIVEFVNQSEELGVAGEPVMLPRCEVRGIDPDSLANLEMAIAGVMGWLSQEALDRVTGAPKADRS